MFDLGWVKNLNLINVNLVSEVSQNILELGWQDYSEKIKLIPTLVLMMEEKNLDKIKEDLSINKKTAFDWRHIILTSLSDSDKNDFTGITESDETFFLNSEKGRAATNRKPRKRRGRSKTRGICRNQVVVSNHKLLICKIRIQ